MAATFTIGEVELPGYRGGNGRPVLLLHGGRGPGSITALGRRLAERFDVHQPVHPSFEDAPEYDQLDRIDDLAYLYMDYLDGRDLTDVVVIGFSMGGWIAAEMAVRSTARIGALLLVDAVGVRFGGPESDEIADLFAISPAEWAKVAFHDPERMLAELGTPDEAQQVMQARNRRALARFGWEPYLHNPKLKQWLHRIDVPTLVLWGESDGIVGLNYARNYTAAIPGARLEVIERAGHQPQIEQPEAFDAVLLKFLGES